MKPVSMQRRLVWALLGAFLGVGSATALIGYRDAHQSVDSVLDAHLLQTAHLITAQAAHELDEMDPEDLRELAPWSQRVTVQVWDEEGRELYRSREAPRLAPPPPDDALSDVEVGGSLWRVYVMRDRATGTRVAVAEDHAPREALARRIALDAVLPLVIALPVIALLVGWIVRRGLQPLSQLGEEIERRGAHALEPLGSDGVPEEARPLVARLDDLLQRLRTSLEQERHFASNAAHELRNPLAALRAQAELARDSRDQAEARRALEAVIKACDRLTRLVEQLLLLARVEESGGVAQPLRVDLLVRSIIADLAPSVLAAGQDIALECDGPVTVDGDQVLLGAMVRNLIDNALRHGGDPARITVHVDGGSQHARITVDDEGPGLAPDALERIGRRFERLDAPADYGVGLGLALVARIARWHGGDFRIFSREGRPGTRAEVMLPVQAARADTGAA